MFYEDLILVIGTGALAQEEGDCLPDVMCLDGPTVTTSQAAGRAIETESPPTQKTTSPTTVRTRWCSGPKSGLMQGAPKPSTGYKNRPTEMRHASDATERAAAYEVCSEVAARAGPYPPL